MRIILISIFFAIVGNSMAQQFNVAKVSERLQNAIENYPDDYYHEFSILLSDRVDIAEMDAKFYERNASLSERTYEVITTLKEKAASTQAPIISRLNNSNKVLSGTIQAFWISNIIYVQAQKALIVEMSQRTDVGFIDLIDQAIPEFGESVDCEESTTVVIPNGKERGHSVIKANKLWQMGYTGYGRIAMGNDTGVDPTHPSLTHNNRAVYAPIEQTWFEGSFNPSSTAYDCGDHGTHVMGTTLGIDRLNRDTIGVAFNAHWIGSPLLCPGVSNLGAFQWALDPDNNPNTINDMPDVINNSWGFSVDAQLQCNSQYVDALNAAEAAGIAVVFSAGNSGPGPATITPPHNINTNLVNSFSVGNINATVSTLPINDGSSRGPSRCGGTNSLLIKPEVSAPGTSVRSAVPGGMYDNKSGTSMAAPHVSGAILLLKEAFPELTGTEIKLALYFSAVDLGEEGEDNSFGMGLIDVEAAFDYLVQEGHTPVDPSFESDLVLVDMKLKSIECNGQVSPVFTVDNQGSTPVSTFTISYNLDGATSTSDTYTWTGELAVGERISFEIDPINAAEGDYTLMATLDNTDDRILNNALAKPVTVSAAPALSVYIDEDATEICQQSQAILHADDGGIGTIRWYNNLVGGAPLEVGPTFLTPELNQSQSFYAETTITDHLGKLEPGEASALSDQDGALIFDAYRPFVLKSVKVFTEQTGFRFITLREQNGDVVTDKLVQVPGDGVNVVDLNFRIDVGQNYRLELTSGNPLETSTTALEYPYTLDGIASIKRTDHIFPNSVYFYFYDWEIEHLYECGREEIVVDVIPSEFIPDAHFGLSTDTVDIQNDGTIMFTDSSSNAVSWFWNFGDGTSSMEQNPIHVYNSIGTFTVILTVTNEDGCSDVSTYDIVAEGTSSVNPIGAIEDRINVYPNPTRHFINLDFSFDRRRAVNVQVIDPLGRVIQRLDTQNIQEDILQLNMSEYTDGLYYFVIKVDDEVFTKKTLKLH